LSRTLVLALNFNCIFLKTAILELVPCICRFLMWQS
jgi:hypothetical protein